MHSKRFWKAWIRTNRDYKIRSRHRHSAEQSLWWNYFSVRWTSISSEKVKSRIRRKHTWSNERNGGESESGFRARKKESRTLGGDFVKPFRDNNFKNKWLKAINLIPNFLKIFLDSFISWVNLKSSLIGLNCFSSFILM